jgi:hypothetical protein
VLGTNFTSTEFRGLENAYKFYVIIDNIVYYVNIDSIQDDNNAQIYDVRERTPETNEYNEIISETWPFASGTYQAFYFVNDVQTTKLYRVIGTENIIDQPTNGAESNDNVVGAGNYLLNTSDNSIIGNRNRVRGQGNIIAGNYNTLQFTLQQQGYIAILGSGNQIIDLTSGNPSESTITGFSNQINQQSNQIRNHIIACINCILDAHGGNNAIINSYETTLGGTNSTINRVTAIGFHQEQLDFAVLTNCVVVPRLLVYEIPVFESDALAAAGGLISGMAYRNAAGQAFYKLP